MKLLNESHTSLFFVLSISNAFNRPRLIHPKPQERKKNIVLFWHSISPSLTPHRKFHGGSGSDVSDIQEAIGYGVIKMNIDTDTQWSYWEGIKNFEKKYHDYLQGQIGNPDGPDKPNKKYYDVSFCY